MQNKLQELTDKLYNDGLSKGRDEGEALLKKAKENSERIIAEANDKASQIIAEARKQAEELRSKAEGDIKMASTQSIQAAKHQIETLITGKAISKEIESKLSTPDFLKTIITTVAEKFSSEQPVDIELALPESLKKELEPFVQNELSKVLNKGVDVKFNKKIKGGFTIGPKNGGYFISMTDEAFTSLISAYMRPATKKFLFDD